MSFQIGQSVNDTYSFGLDQVILAFLLVLARTRPVVSIISISMVSARMKSVGLLESGSTLTSSVCKPRPGFTSTWERSEEHTSELQSRLHLVCRLLLEKKK